MVKNKKLLYGILVIAVLAIAGIGLFVYQNKLITTEKINSFEECIKAGYPVLESYPRQCKTQDGKTFVEEVTPPKKLPKLERCKDVCGNGKCEEIVCMAIGCPCPETPESCPEDCKQKAEVPNAEGPNPAAVYCKDLGYKLEAGDCIFPDESKCKEWSFFRGKCGQQFTFCGQQGFTIENITDNMGTWTAEYAVCIFDDGSECLEQDYFEGKCNRAECRKWKMSEGGCIKSQ